MRLAVLIALAPLLSGCASLGLVADPETRSDVITSLIEANKECERHIQYNFAAGVLPSSGIQVGGWIVCKPVAASEVTP